MLLLIATYLLMGCHEKPHAHYVYLDSQRVLHASQSCKAVAKIHNAQPVSPIAINYLQSEMLREVCSQCIDEKTLFALQKIAEENDSLQRNGNYIITVNGVQRKIKAEKFNENIDAFVDQMPDATIRMRDRYGKEHDIKLADISNAYENNYEYVTK